MKGTISERLRSAYNAWNNPPSEGLPTDAECVLVAADTIDELVEALEMIAGERQCLDSLMGNEDIARAALAKARKGG